MDGEEETTTVPDNLSSPESPPPEEQGVPVSRDDSNERPNDDPQANGPAGWHDLVEEIEVWETAVDGWTDAVPLPSISTEPANHRDNVDVTRISWPRPPSTYIPYQDRYTRCGNLRQLERELDYLLPLTQQVVSRIKAAIVNVDRLRLDLYGDDFMVSDDEY